MKKIFTLLLLFILTSISLSSQDFWQKEKATDTLNVTSFYVHEDDVFEVVVDSNSIYLIDGIWMIEWEDPILDSLTIVSMHMRYKDIILKTKEKGLIINEYHIDSWEDFNKGLNGDKINEILTIDTRLYAVSDSNIYYTDDMEWISIKKNLPDDRILALSRSGGVVSTENNGVFRYDDGWYSDNDDFVNRKVNFLYYLYGYTYAITDKNEIMELNHDRPDRWRFLCKLDDSIVVNDYDIAIATVLPIFGPFDVWEWWENHIVCTENAGVFIISQDGDSVKHVNDGLDNKNIRNVEVLEREYVYIRSNDNDIYKGRERLTKTTDVHDISIKAELLVSPNPASDNIKISYNLLSPAHISIDIHDIFGTKLATVVDNDLAAGEYSESFDASDLPSGSYICRFGIDGEFVSERFVVER